MAGGCEHVNEPLDSIKRGEFLDLLKNYVGHLESKERLRIQPAQLFHFS